MQYVYFLLLLLFFCWLLTRSGWFSGSGLSAKLLVSLFLIRIIASLVGFYLSVFYYDYSDSLLFHRYGIEEYDLIFSDLRAYLTNLFRNDYAKGYAGFFDTSQSYWNNLGSNMIIKLLSLFNLISFKSFLINTLLYNFLVFCAPIALFKVFINLYPQAKTQIILAVFLFPSALLFTSVIHKDGLIFLFLSFTLYHFFFWLKGKKKDINTSQYPRQNSQGQQFKSGISPPDPDDDSSSMKKGWWRLFKGCCFLFLIFCMRGYVLILLLPALAAWFLASIKPARSLIIYSSLYALFAALFFLSPYISRQIDLPGFVSGRQASFQEIAQFGSSTLPTDTLYPHFDSFIKNAPQAINHAFLRPYLFEGKWFYLPFSLEVAALVILFLFAAVFRQKKHSTPPLFYFLVFFSLSMCLVIGYTVPILGAIVRYRSIYFMLVFLVLLLSTDWLSVRQMGQRNLSDKR